MMLSKNLSLKEMVATSTGIINEPSDAEVKKLFIMAQFLFQPIRKRWGPIRITSGFRTEAVNSAVGGSETSQHILAEAFDMQPIHSNILAVWLWLKDHISVTPAFGQAILGNVGRKKWIHLSMPRMEKNNMIMLKYDGVKYISV